MVRLAMHEIVHANVAEYADTGLAWSDHREAVTFVRIVLLLRHGSDCGFLERNVDTHMYHKTHT